MNTILDKIKKLPFDIQMLILPYTYNIQNQYLLEDIQHFQKSKTIISKKYVDLNHLELNHPYNLNKQKDSYWFIIDLFIFINDNQAISLGNTDFLYLFFYRYPCLENKEMVNQYIIQMKKKELEIQINIIWGLLTVKERNDFTKNYSIYYL